MTMQKKNRTTQSSPELNRTLAEYGRAVFENDNLQGEIIRLRTQIAELQTRQFSEARAIPSIMAPGVPVTRPRIHASPNGKRRGPPGKRGRKPGRRPASAEAAPAAN